MKNKVKHLCLAQPLRQRLGHTCVPCWSPRLHYQLWLPASVHPGKQQMMSQVVGFLRPTMETWMEFLASDFGLVQPQLLWVFGEEPV